jgi:hypothetical protein
MPINHEGKTYYSEDEVQTKIDNEVAGLKTTLSQLKDEKKDLETKRKEQEEAARNAEIEKAKLEGDFETQLKLERERRESEQRANDDLKMSIRKEKIDNFISGIVMKNGAGGSHNEDLRDLLAVRHSFDYDFDKGSLMVDGQIVDSEGFEKTITTSGRYDSYLAGSKASGSGSAGSKPANGSKPFAEMTEQERVQLFKDNPEEFKRLSAN